MKQQKNIRNWNELRRNCPIDITRIEKNYKKFNRLISYPTLPETTLLVRKGLVEARTLLILLITELTQELAKVQDTIDIIIFDKELEKRPNILPIMDQLDRRIMDLDSTRQMYSEVGIIGRFASFQEQLREIADGIVLSTLLTATSEYVNFEEDKEKGIVRNKRTFLHILLRHLSQALEFQGSPLRLGKNPKSQGLISWRDNVSIEGQQEIADDYAKKTGKKIDIVIPEELKENNNIEEEAISI